MPDVDDSINSEELEHPSAGAMDEDPRERSQEELDLESVTSQDDCVSERFRDKGRTIGHIYKSETLGIKVVQYRLFKEEYDPASDTVKGYSCIRFSLETHGYDDDVELSKMKIIGRRDIDRTVLPASGL